MSARDLNGARSLYRAFREEEPKKPRRITIDVPKVVAVMGPCEFVGYATTHRGKVTLYIHEFAPGSRPLLCAGPRRNQLFLVGGRFKVTGRGITDLSPDGRTVHAVRRYEVRVRGRGRGRGGSI